MLGNISIIRVWLACPAPAQDDAKSVSARHRQAAKRRGERFMTTARFMALVLVCFLGADSVHAHFLFVRILPPAEAGRYAEVYFSDQADAGDPRFIDRIASTKLWVQTKPGSFEPLKTHKTPDRLRALVPSNGSIGVIGECTYGVLARPKATPFLLRHYPKAVAGSMADVCALQPKAEIPFEIQVRNQGDELEFVALRNGKPIPDAKFIAVGSDLKDHHFGGKWKPSAPGHYAVYTSQTLKASGVHQREKYEEVREFATLAFAWPLETQAADSKAVALFQEAIAARASWSHFPGFRAQVKANADGRSWKGNATITAKGDVALAMEDDVVAPWVKEQLESIVLHRLARPQGKEPILRFGDGDPDHPLGRLLIFDGGKFASSYRVKDRQIVVVNRNLGKTNMTITVLDNDQNAEKKFLPRSYTVHYWDATSGQLERTETIQNRWTRVGSWDLPTTLTVQTSSSAGQSVKTMTLSQHQLLAGK
jgi:hypothetical protein